jgi:AraC-like DNA-binding protein
MTRNEASRAPAGHATLATWGMRVLIGYLEARGVDVASIRSRGGLEGVDLGQPDQRLPEGVPREVWTLAARATGDEAIAIHVAEGRTPAAVDVLEYAFRASPTLRDALGQVVRYGRVMHDRVALRLEPEGDAARLTGAVPPAHPINRYQAEFFLATWLRLARETCARDLVPVEVHFAHPAPTSIDEHRRFFACPVLFDQPDVGLLFAGADLDRPMHGADPALTSLLGRQLDRLLEGLPADASVTSRARALVKEDLPSGSAFVERVARQLAMSVRTLSRRLDAEGTSFRQLLESVRQELAFAHLRDPAVEIGEIAFLLGYSESSAFHRWFKRRTGRTPLEFRREPLSGGPPPSTSRGR